MATTSSSPRILKAVVSAVRSSTSEQSNTDLNTLGNRQNHKKIQTYSLDDDHYEHSNKKSSGRDDDRYESSSKKSSGRDDDRYESSNKKSSGRDDDRYESSNKKSSGRDDGRQGDGYVNPNSGGDRAPINKDGRKGINSQKKLDGPLQEGDIVKVDLTSNVALSGLSANDYVLIKVGDSLREAVYVSSDATGRVHTFQYTVQAGDTDNSGGITLDSLTTTAADSLGAAVSAKLPAQNNNIKVDALGPALLAKTAGSITEKADLTLNFGEAMKLGSGEITVWNSDGSVFEILDVVADKKRISFSQDRKTVKVNPYDDLIAGNSYYVTVDAGAFVDGAGNLFEGFSTEQDWNFQVDNLVSSITWKNCDLKDACLNAKELDKGSISGKITNLNGAVDVTIESITFKSLNGGQNVVVDPANLPVISQGGVWTLRDLPNMPDGDYEIEVMITGQEDGNTVSTTAMTAVFHVDATPPIISTLSVVGLDDFGATKTTTLKAGDKIQVTLASNEEVIGWKKSSAVTLDVGGKSRLATYLKSDGNNHFFEYTLKKGDSDTDGIVVGKLNTKGLTDTACNAAVLDSSTATYDKILVDTVPPKIATNTVKVLNDKQNTKLAGDQLVEGDQVIVTLTATEQLQGFTNKDMVVVSLGKNKRQATYLESSADGITHTFSYSVQLIDVATVGLVKSEGISISNNVTDLAGNALNIKSYNVQNTATDIVSAVVSGLSASGGIKSTLIAGDIVQVVLTSNKAIKGWGTNDTVSLSVGDTVKDANYLSSQGNRHYFRYTVQNGDNDSVGGISLKAITTSATDSKGNIVSLSIPNQINKLIVDTTAPDAPISAFAIDSGATGDGISNSAQINVSNIEAGSTWQYQVDGGSWNAGRGSTLNALEGEHTYAFKAIDKAGNSSAPSVSKIYTLDTVAPQVTNKSPSIKADDPLNVAFGEAVKIGTGDIVIMQKGKNGVADSVFQTIKVETDVQSATPLITLSNDKKSVSIDTSVPFQTGESYYVQVPTTAIKDIADNAFAGFTDTSWQFNVI